MAVDQLYCIVEEVTIRRKADCVDRVQLTLSHVLIQKRLSSDWSHRAFILCYNRIDFFLILLAPDEVFNAEHWRISEDFGHLDNSKLAHHFVATQLRH